MGDLLSGAVAPLHASRSHYRQEVTIRMQFKMSLELKAATAMLMLYAIVQIV